MALRFAACLPTRLSSYQTGARRSLTVRMAASAAAPAPKYWVLRYDYVPDILEKRGPFREQHLKSAQDKMDAGQLVCGGATGSPPDGALFIFKDATQQEIEHYVKADPYVQNGLVSAYKISPYAVAVGNP